MVNLASKSQSDDRTKLVEKPKRIFSWFIRAKKAGNIIYITEDEIF